MLEQELIKLNGQLVTVVRPFFGSQSESFRAPLEVMERADGFWFHLSMENSTMIFKFNDIRFVEGEPTKYIIYLKEPTDYEVSFGEHRYW